MMARAAAGNASGNIDLPRQPEGTLDAKLWQEFLHFADPGCTDAGRHELAGIDLQHLPWLGATYGNWPDEAMTGVIDWIRSLSEWNPLPKHILGKWVKPPSSVKGLARKGIAGINRKNGRTLRRKAAVQVAQSEGEMMIHAVPSTFIGVVMMFMFLSFILIADSPLRMLPLSTSVMMKVCPNSCHLQAA